MKRIHYTGSLALACILGITQVHAQAKLVQTVEKKGNAFSIPYKKYVLPNGLTLILTEDHSDPIVQVDVTYHVGSAREEIGKSGFAHFFEHMMFEGSEHVASGEHFKIIDAAGGTFNGSTNQDRTDYFETVPSNQLEKMLWLESDRMGFLLDAVTQKKFENQRATVKNERGENYDNRQYGLAREATAKAFYPYGHPYSWLTIGYIEDLNKVDVNDLKRFFLRWYGPNNATLTIGGDIQTAQTVAWVEKYFGAIPRGPEVKPVVYADPAIPANRYISYTDNFAHLPKLFITYPGVKMYAKDNAALNALAMIIGQGENSILYKNMIKTHQASDATMSISSAELAGQISITATPYPGQTMAGMKKLVDSSLAEFEQHGVTDDDLTRFKGQTENEFISALASVSGKVRELVLAQAITGNPDQIITAYNDIRNVTKADVMRVYHDYIKGKGAVVLSVLPRQGNAAAAAADNYTADTLHYQAPDYGYTGLVYHKAHDSFDRNIPPPAGPNPVIKVPSYWTDVTPNGIKMIGSYNGEIPSVNLILSVKGGGLLAAKDPSKAGLPGIVAAMLNNDTQQHTAEQMNAMLEKLGSDIQAGAGAEMTSFYVSSLTQHLDSTLALLEERLLHPKFTQEALDRIKKERIQNLQNAKTQISSIANKVWGSILYGSNSLYITGLNGKEQTLQNITLADVQSFYDHYFAPGITSVVVVGDIQQEEIKHTLQFLNNWANKPVSIPPADIHARPLEKNTLYLVDVPHAAQSEINIGYVTGVKYDPTGTAYKLNIACYPLGGSFTSRLNADLREEKGWTYGAGAAFASDKNTGTFMASASVNAPATDSAVMELLKDITTYANDGITPTELALTKSAISQGNALEYETNGKKASFLSDIQLHDLKPSFVSAQRKLLENLTKPAIDALANQYLDITNMAILVVGDKAAIMPGLQKTGYNIVELDADGTVKENIQ